MNKLIFDLYFQDLEFSVSIKFCGSYDSVSVTVGLRTATDWSCVVQSGRRSRCFEWRGRNSNFPKIYIFTGSGFLCVNGNGAASDRHRERQHSISNTSHYIYINIFRLNLILSFGFFFFSVGWTGTSALKTKTANNPPEYGRTLNIPYSLFICRREQARVRKHTSRSHSGMVTHVPLWKHVVFESVLMVFNVPHISSSPLSVLLG